MILETLLGSALGGVFRLVPEVLKWSDRKNERAHELAMLDHQLQADKLRGDMAQKQAETEGKIAIDTAELAALTEAIKGQAEMAVAAGGWAAKASALVRPLITYWWVIFLYTAALIAQFVLLYDAGFKTSEAILKLWGPDEKAIVATIITFWFVDRVLRQRLIGK